MNDLAGRIFSRLTVIEKDPIRKNHRLVWKCQCKCGNTLSVMGSSLLNGNTRSCGCLKIERVIKMGEAKATHGHTRRRVISSEFRAWNSMKDRCLNPNHPGFKHWGGRGITICERWQHSFENFLADVGFKSSPRLSLDRINNNGNYEPGNVHWATWIQQANNRRPRNS